MGVIFIKFLLPLIISVWLIYISETKKIVNKKMKINGIVVLIALLIPSIVSASRNIINIGDTKLYGDLIFNYAINNDWEKLISFFHNNYYSIETGYLALTFIISRFTSNYNILFFIISFINVFLIYDGLKYLKEHMNLKIWLGMLIFYLIFFGETLNIVRQSLGVAILFWGIHYLFEGEKYKYVACVIVAVFFHISCVMGLVLLPLFSIINKSEKKSLVWVSNISIVALITVILYPQLFEFVRRFSFIPSKFFSLYYLNGKPISPFALVTKLPMVLVLYVFIKGKKYENKYQYFFLLMLLLDLIISQLSGGNDNLYRFALIFGYFKIAIFSENSTKLFQRIVIVYSFMYFYMEYIYQGALPIELFL